MIFNRVANIQKINRLPALVAVNRSSVRSAITSPSGSILPEPKKPRFGYVGVFCAVCSGLFIGSTISKVVANFLEENELFVPDDDDDDD